MNLTNKTVIITGSSDGIGKHIAFKLAAQKCNLILIARNQERLDSVKSEALDLGAPQVSTYICDLCNIDEIESTVESIKTDVDQVDVLINNAGIRQKLSPIEEVSVCVIQDIINTNLTGLIQLTSLMMPILKASEEESVIINVSSKSGYTTQVGQTVYTASKRGVRGFTETLKTDLKGSNIRVAGIYQSGTNTQMFAKTDEDFPIEKFTDPADLADVVVYMLSLPAKIWLNEIRVEY